MGEEKKGNANGKTGKKMGNMWKNTVRGPRNSFRGDMLTRKGKRKELTKNYGKGAWGKEKG